MADELQWIKAQASAGLGACVEARRDGSEVAMRNSRDPRPELSFTQAEFAAFVDGVKKGEFDPLLD